jgi:hypothetical protein
MTLGAHLVLGGLLRGDFMFSIFISKINFQKIYI